MSASKKLRALEVAMDANAGRSAGFEAHISYLNAFPQIVAVVKAVEQATRYDYCYDDVGDDGAGMCSSSDGEYVEWQDIGDALAALDKALVSAGS